MYLQLRRSFDGMCACECGRRQWRALSRGMCVGPRILRKSFSVVFGSCERAGPRDNDCSRRAVSLFIDNLTAKVSEACGPRAPGPRCTASGQRSQPNPKRFAGRLPERSSIGLLKLTFRSRRHERRNIFPFDSEYLEVKGQSFPKS